MNKKEKLKIGIDLDDTLWEYQLVFLNFYNKKFKTNYSLKEFSVYSLEEFLNLSNEEVVSLLDEFGSHPGFMNLPLIEGAKETIHELKKKHELFFITARPPSRKELTQEFFLNHFGLKEKIYFLGGASSSNLKTKGEMGNFLGIDLMIDDHLTNLKSCLNYGIPSFLMDRPWNKEEEIKGIKRVKNWREILELIK
ncbi:hypothetical protein GW931_01955 [archaeon]|nr:hypothetical protein [archaeon]